MNAAASSCLTCTKRIASRFLRSASMMPLMPSPGSPKTVSTPQSCNVSTRMSAAVMIFGAFRAGCPDELVSASLSRSISVFVFFDLFFDRFLGLLDATRRIRQVASLLALLEILFVRVPDGFDVGTVVHLRLEIVVVLGWRAHSLRPVVARLSS